jgi:hypothetical protein
MSDKQENDISGFKNALFINPMQCDQEMGIHSLPERLESLNIGTDYVLSSKTTPKSSDTKLNEYKNFLTKDLLQHLDESPTKPKATLASLRRTSELYMSGGEDEEIPKQQHSLFYQQRQGLSKNPEKDIEDLHNEMYMKAQQSYDNHVNMCSGGLTYNPYNPNVFIPSDIEVCNLTSSPEDCNGYHRSSSRIKKLSPNEDYSFIPKNFEADGFKQNVGVFNPTNTLTRNIPSFFPKNIDSKSQVKTVPKVGDNKSFMYGKTGWICSMCKNFNYESKYFPINRLVRSKCNRCGKPQARPDGCNMLRQQQQQMQSQPMLFDNEAFSLNKQAYMGCSVDQHTDFEEYNMTAPNSSTNINFNSSVGESISSTRSDHSSDDKTNSVDSKKKKKPFVERVGDWVCIKCKNLNFSFRMICNRCQLPKLESDKLFEQYMKNLMNYVKLNEMFQNQIIVNNSVNNQNNFINRQPQQKNVMKSAIKKDRNFQEAMYSNNYYNDNNSSSNGNYGNSRV